MERKIIIVFSLAIVAACATGASGQSAINQLGATRPQNIPVPKPVMVAVPCPGCNKMINTPNHKMPTTCPYCGYSFGQGTKPRPSPSHGGPYMPFQGTGNMNRQPVQSQSDDRLYYDGIETRGGLKTRHFDPDGLAARAEKWGQDMRQVDEQSQKKKDALARSLDNDKKDLLEKDGKAIALPQLKNPFANDPNVVDLSKSDKPLTPSIPPMKDVKPNGEPIYEADLNPLKALSDEQLEKKREALGKAISEVAKLQAATTSEYADLESNAQAGKDMAWKAVQDAGTTIAFGTLQTVADKKATSSLMKAIDIDEGGLSPAKIAAMRQAAEASKAAEAVKKGAAGVDAINLNVTLANGISDPTSIANYDTVGQIATITSGFIPTASRFPVVPPKYFSWMAKSKTPIGAIPGAVQSGIDTGLVWANYWKQALDSSRQEELQKQHNANLLRLSLEQTRVIEEQNRRKRAGVTN